MSASESGLCSDLILLVTSVCAEADAEKSGVKLQYNSSNMSYADFLAKYDTVARVTFSYEPHSMNERMRAAGALRRGFVTPMHLLKASQRLK